MPWQSGVYVRTDGTFTGDVVWQEEDSVGKGIGAARMDTHDQDVASAVNSCLNINGVNSMAANLRMGGFPIADLGEPTADGDMARVDSLSGAVKTDGTSTVTDDIPMNNNKITGIRDGVAADDLAAFGQIQDGDYEWVFVKVAGTGTPTITAQSGGISVQSLANTITNVIFSSNASSADAQGFMFSSCYSAAPIYGRFPTVGAGQRTVNSTWVIQDGADGVSYAQRDFYLIRVKQ